MYKYSYIEPQINTIINNVFYYFRYLKQKHIYSIKYLTYSSLIQDIFDCKQYFYSLKFDYYELDINYINCFCIYNDINFKRFNNFYNNNTLLNIHLTGHFILCLFEFFNITININSYIKESFIPERFLFFNLYHYLNRYLLLNCCIKRQNMYDTTYFKIKSIQFYNVKSDNTDTLFRTELLSSTIIK